jgi:hypothetical protein
LPLGLLLLSCISAFLELFFIQHVKWYVVYKWLQRTHF